MNKILFLSDNLGSGGAQRQMVTVARLLKKQGFIVSFLCYDNANFYEYILIQNKIPVYWLNEQNYIKRIIKIRKYIHNGNFNTVISFLETPNFLNNISAIGRKTWKVITGERSAQKNTFLSLRGKIFALFQRYSDEIVCNSENAKSLWMNYFPRYSNKLQRIYNCVLLPSITSQYIIRKGGRTHILVAASYQYLKNPLNLIYALNSLDDNFKQRIEVSWYGRKEVTAGNTECYDVCCELVNKYNLQQNIHLCDESQDIYNKMNEADCIALFSSVEGLPNVICEGMMIGKPIIMTKVSDYKVLVDSLNGFLCDWDDIDSIKEILCQLVLMKDDDLLKKGISSKLKSKLLFSEKEITNQWMSIIR